MGSSEPARAEVTAESTPAAHLAPGEAGAAHSRFVQRIRRRYVAELGWLAPGLPRRESIMALVERLRGPGRSLVAALRVARQNAPALTDFRLYWERVADVLGGKSKVILDEEPGRRRHLIVPSLPLEKLLPVDLINNTMKPSR